MGSIRVVRNLLLLAFCTGRLDAMPVSSSLISVRSSSPNPRCKTTGHPPIWGFLSRDAPAERTGKPVRRLGRTLATAVTSTSYLQTGRTASGVVESVMEGGLQTFGAFVSGALMGGIIGAFMGGTFGKVPDVGLLTSVTTKAGQMGGSWGKLTAAFTGFTQLSIVIRGRNDKWDHVFGACGAGAYLNRAKGPQAMLQGAASYGLFSLVFAAQKSADDMDVMDIPVNPPSKTN